MKTYHQGKENNMFKMFTKKDTDELSFNEREGLIDNYLRLYLKIFKSLNL